MKVAFRHRPRKMRRRVDAASAVHAQNAPTAPWKTAQSAVSHSDHTHHLLDEGRSETIPLTRLTHEIPDTTSGGSPAGRFHFPEKKPAYCFPSASNPSRSLNTKLQTASRCAARHAAIAGAAARQER